MGCQHALHFILDVLSMDGWLINKSQHAIKEIILSGTNYRQNGDPEEAEEVVLKKEKSQS